jgi:hypothetical protein
MPPFEHLRAIVRYGDDGDVLVAEMAECLARFDDDPAALVVTCRRLLAHHPESTALWWLCSRVLAAPEASAAAWESEERLRRDPTAARLGALLPFPADHPVGVLGWPVAVGDALESRPDLEVLAVRGSGAARGWERRLRHCAVDARPVDLAQAAAAEVSHVLIGVVAAGGNRIVAADGTTDALDILTRPGIQVWGVAPVGSVLPDRLVGAQLAELEPLADRHLELVDAQRFDRFAGPDGLVRADQLGRRADCPVAPELLRIR